MSLTKNGHLLRALQDWERLAGPKRANQWKDGRSAKESARAWLGADSPALPPEIDPLFTSHADFGRVLHWEGEPEVRLRFDQRRGEPRNTDLLLTARDDHGEFLIAVEAKADETFGELVSDALSGAVERRLANPRSGGVARIEDLAASLLGPRHGGTPGIGGLRYQLLTATAGALKAAADRKVDRVVLLIHEFHTDHTTDERHSTNAVDLNRFVARLTRGGVTSVAQGRLYRMVRVPGPPLFGISPPRLYIGKAVRSLRGVVANV
jgi:hypothetical protein